MKNVNLQKVTFANHRKISNHVSNQSQFSKGGPFIDVVQVLDDFGVWNRKWPYILIYIILPLILKIMLHLHTYTKQNLVKIIFVYKYSKEFKLYES